MRLRGEGCGCDTGAERPPPLSVGSASIIGMDEYPPGDVALLSLTDPIVDSGARQRRPDDEAVLLDVAAHFASEHGVPGPEGRPVDRERSLWRAARQWPLLVVPRPDRGRSEDEVVELLRDAVDARDRFPRLWSAATEDGAVGGRELRQLVRQHRDKALSGDPADRRRSGRRPAVRAGSVARRVPGQSVPRTVARPRSDRRPDPRPAGPAPAGSGRRTAGLLNRRHPLGPEANPRGGAGG